MSLMKQRGMVFFQCSSLNTDIKLEQLVCITFPSASGLQTRTRMEGIDRSSAQTSCAAASRHFLEECVDVLLLVAVDPGVEVVAEVGVAAQLPTLGHGVQVLLLLAQLQTAQRFLRLPANL